MLYREIIAVCSEMHTKHINTLCGQNVVVTSVLSTSSMADEDTKRHIKDTHNLSSAQQL